MPNLLFPGRPNYTGPMAGVFGLLHHEVLVESSYNVAERVVYIKANKPTNEIAIRLHNMIYLGDCEAAVKLDALDADRKAKRAALRADYEAKLDALDADYTAKHAPLDANYWAKRAALWDDYETKRVSLDANYWTKRVALAAAVVAHIAVHIPDHAWNGSELIFPKEPQ